MAILVLRSHHHRGLIDITALSTQRDAVLLMLKERKEKKTADRSSFYSIASDLQYEIRHTIERVFVFSFLFAIRYGTSLTVCS